MKALFIKLAGDLIDIIEYPLFPLVRRGETFELDPRLLCEKRRRVPKLNTFVFLDESKNIATLAAAETVPYLFFRRYHERRGLFLMKRAEPFEIGAGLLQRNIVGDQLLDGQF